MKSENMIPKAYMQSSDMRTMCRIFDLEYNLLKYYTDRILDCYSPEHCQEHLLPELATHIGFDYQERKTVMYNRIVLKHFIRDLIRYRGSRTGIRNAAAIDIRYRQVFPKERFNIETKKWEKDPNAGEQMPMNYHEAIPIEKTWIDVDNTNGIIYLFIIANGYFPPIPNDATLSEKKELSNERMRRLLDLAYLQEYVRPVGMYLLPMVAEKVDIHTDLTVKAVVIPPEEKGMANGVSGTPNATDIHKYDRIHFAHVEDNTLNTEPWIRTLYHSQIAGHLEHEYFTKPVYHIEGKFLYYDHSELLEIYKSIMEKQTGGLKVGDSIYNPNISQGPGDFSYGPNPIDEPEDIIASGESTLTTEPLAYEDHVNFPSPRILQKDIPVGADGSDLRNEYPAYLIAGDADDGTNKNLMINLFQVDISTGTSLFTGANDINIAGKAYNEETRREEVPYNSNNNTQAPTGDDAIFVVNNPDENGDNKPDEPIIP